MAHANLLGMAGKYCIGRYGGLIWNNFGFKEVDAQVVFPLSTSEGYQID